MRPLAAVREVAIDRSGTSSRRAVGGAMLLVAGLALAVTGREALGRTGIGALLTVAGTVVIGPVVARRASGIIAWPLPRLRGAPGVLARGNAMRNPKRTSSTAMALMIGVCVVTLFTVFAASLKASVAQRTGRAFGGDLVINSGRFGGGGFSPRLAGDVARLPEVADAAGLGGGAALVAGRGERLTITQPAALAGVVDLGTVRGSIGRLGTGQLAVSAKVADRHHWQLGTAVPVTFADRRVDALHVGAIFDQREVVGDYVVGRATWSSHATQDIDSTVLIKLSPSTDVAAGRRAVERVASVNGGPDVLDKQGYIKASTAAFDTMLGIVYVMLALAIVIALMGIANTLALSIQERTRELGLLRAVGETRGQVRSMVRWESVIVALFGTVGGLGLGLVLGWSLVHAASSDTIGTFSAPGGQLAVVLIAGATAGLLAARGPARRAARLDVLAAIATD